MRPIACPRAMNGAAASKSGHNGSLRLRIKTTAAWGLYFPVWEARLIPTQIFMALGQLVIYAILRQSAPGLRARAGDCFILYLLLSSVERFTIEFFRADHEVYAGFSIFQYICAAIFAVALILLFRKRL